MGFDKNSGYYSFRELLGYNAKYSILLSPDRGVGKTYGYKRMLINDPGMSVIVYRQKPDLEHAVENWLDDLTIKGPKEQRYPVENFKWSGGVKEGYCLWTKQDSNDDFQRKIYFRALSEANAIKQETFPDEVVWVVWDEFIPVVWKKIAGIANEGDTFRQIMKTIDHDSVHSREERGLRPLRAILIANPLTWGSPVLSYFGVNPLMGYGVHRSRKKFPDGTVAWEYLGPKGETSGLDIHTRDLIKQQQSFVEQKPKESIPVMSLRLWDMKFVFWRRSVQQGIYWVTESKEHVGEKRYGTMDGLTEDEVALESMPMLMRGIVQYAQHSLLRYEDINTKFDYLQRIADIH